MRFTLRGQYCLLWSAELQACMTLISGLRVQLHTCISRRAPWTGWVRLYGPFWPFAREPFEPRIRLRARTELTRMLTLSEGCTTLITFRKVRSTSHPDTWLLCSPTRNKRNGSGAFTWSSVVESWRWRSSGSLCPSNNNNPGRTASSHCEHEDGRAAVIPLVGARGSSHFTPDDGRKDSVPKGSWALIKESTQSHSLSRRTKCRPEALLQEWLPPPAPNQPAATRRLPLPALLPFPPSPIRCFPSSPLSSSTLLSSPSSLLLTVIQISEVCVHSTCIHLYPEYTINVELYKQNKPF